VRTVLPWIGKPAQQYPFVLGALQQRRPRNQDCNIPEKLCSCLVASGVQVDATLSLNSSSASSSPPAAESGSFHMTGATFITFLAGEFMFSWLCNCVAGTSCQGEESFIHHAGWFSRLCPST
jgi:hypothetical protein